MKITKWSKWQVGAIAALLTAFVFHEVKTSPSFAKATEDASTDSAAQQNTQDPQDIQDQQMDQWFAQHGSGQARGDWEPDSGSSSGGSGGTDDSGSQVMPFGQDNGSGGGFSQPQTRTGRS